MMNGNDLRQLRIKLAQASQWNIGYFCSGFVFWLYVSVTGFLLPLVTARFYWLAGTFLIFPLAVGFSYLLRADPFSKGNPLGELVGYTHMNVITLTFPVVLVTCVFFPEALLLVMAIAYCVDFYVMSWAFGTRIFAIHAAIRTMAVTVVWLVLPDQRTILIPIIVALAYLITFLLIPVLRHRWLRLQTGESR